MEKQNLKILNIFKKHFSVIIMLTNALLIVLAGVFYYIYTSAYNDRSYQENINNISNTNESATINASALFDSWNIKLNDMSGLIESKNCNLNEALELLFLANSTEDRYFQLVGQDKKGFLAQKDTAGEFITLDYSDFSYADSLHSVFDGATNDNFSEAIAFVTEFTDSGLTGAKFFAVYNYINIVGEEKPWTIMLCMKSKYVTELLNTQKKYNGQATVLINGQGNFVINSSYYPSTNFFEYLRERNGLSLAEKDEIIAELNENSRGNLFYKRINGTTLEDYIFSYEELPNISGTKWYCITCVPISSFAKPKFNTTYLAISLISLLLMFVIDVFWLKKINKRLTLSIISEQKANSSKTMFLSRMSHEIRTPLNAVIGYNSIARSEYPMSEDLAKKKQSDMKVLDCLNKCEIASKQLLFVINDILDMSAIESGRIKIINDKIDFKGLISTISTIYYSQAKAKNIHFEVQFASVTEEFLMGDQMRVNQILTNLLSNAIKFTSSGGKIILKITQVDVSSDISHIRFEVSDTGIGMAQDYLGHIWTPFEQASASISRRFGGSGLGLTITKSLVDLMNGTILVESELGKGSKFTVDLDFGLCDNKQKFSNCYKFDKVNVLVVDDDHATCDYVTSLFSKINVRSTAVNSGKEALDAIKLANDKNDDYSVCLVDWQMPEMDGIETIKRIREIANKNMPIIVITAYEYSEIIMKAQEYDINKFIAKPLFQSSLFDLLVDVCGIQREAKKQVAPQFDFSGVRVLLAEDNAMNLEIAKEILSSRGIIVDVANNGKEAIDKFESSSVGFYDAIFMDVHMPIIDGLQATKQIRNSVHKEAKTIPVIAMTADAFLEDIAETKYAGMNDHVAKPIDVAVLFDTLKKYLKK